MKQLVNNIIRKVLNEIENKNIRKAYDLSDIPVEDDDTANNELMKSLIFTPKDKHALKAWIIRKVIIEGPNADLNAVNLEKITDMSWLFSACGKIDFVSPSSTLGGKNYICRWEKMCDYIPYSELRTMPRRSDLGLNGNWRKSEIYYDLNSILAI